MGTTIDYIEKNLNKKEVNGLCIIMRLKEVSRATHFWLERDFWPGHRGTVHWKVAKDLSAW